MKKSRLLAVVFLSVAVLSSVALLGQDRPASDRGQFIGAWRLAWMEETGPDGKVTRTADRTGTLMYTRATEDNLRAACRPKLTPEASVSEGWCERGDSTMKAETRRVEG